MLQYVLNGVCVCYEQASSLHCSGMINWAMAGWRCLRNAWWDAVEEVSKSLHVHRCGTDGDEQIKKENQKTTTKTTKLIPTLG